MQTCLPCKGYIIAAATNHKRVAILYANEEAYTYYCFTPYYTGCFAG